MDLTNLSRLAGKCASGFPPPPISQDWGFRHSPPPQHFTWDPNLASHSFMANTIPTEPAPHPSLCLYFHPTSTVKVRLTEAGYSHQLWTLPPA